jgi:hypothetical protein
MAQRARVFLFEESIDWLDFGFVILSGVLSYAVGWYFIRRRGVVVEGIEPEYQPPKPDVTAFGAVLISDALIRFVTLRLTTFAFTSLYGGAIPLNQALFIGAFAFLVYVLCSFIVVMFISKALLPASLRQAALISALKVSLQLVLWGLFIILQIGYAFLYSER